VKRIIQENPTGCGIACVAMLAGLSYEKVIKVAHGLFGWPKSQRTFYTSSAQLGELLETFGVESQRGRAVRSWESLPNRAIAGINYNTKKNTWHWVVFIRNGDRQYVLDPKSKRERRRDFGRMRLRSCIPVVS
jgi:ABC-type bacteriocin/lantibiotic exporter with double-glycine peptidase domain